MNVQLYLESAAWSPCLVVIASENLGLTGDFTTTAGAGAAITVACGGTN